MGQILHGCATTTEAIRRAIQHSQESLRALAKRYGINQKTVAKWKSRSSLADLPTGPKEPKSTVLSIEEEAIVVAFRKHTLLPLDDCLYSLQATIPHLTRSSLHRCLQRHGISRLPDVEGDKPNRHKFKAYPIGYFHIDIAEVRTEQGKLHMFVAIDRTSKFAFVELHEKATTAASREFLLRLIAAVPYKIHTVLTDNGIQFTTPGAGGSAVPLIKEAASVACSRSWPQLTSLPPTARGARSRDPEPSEPHGPGPRVKTCSSSCLSWLHPLRSWSLRQPRGGSPLNRERAATVIGRNMHRHRHQEFIRFLNAIGAEVPD